MKTIKTSWVAWPFVGVVVALAGLAAAGLSRSHITNKAGYVALRAKTLYEYYPAKLTISIATGENVTDPNKFSTKTLELPPVPAGGAAYFNVPGYSVRLKDVECEKNDIGNIFKR